MFRFNCVAFSAIVCMVASEAVILQRIKRQDVPEKGGHVIDSIFNIPITAIKQTAAAAQSFSPENSQAIDSVLKIPVSTLEAVGNLVKATSGQRRQSAEELQRIRLDRREQRLKRQQIKRTMRFNNKDPLGVNALSILVSNRGILGSIQGVFGGHHGGHVGLGGLADQGGHGAQAGHGGIHGGQGSTGSNHNSYEVYENIEEGANYSWHGIAAGIETFSGSRPTNTRVTVQNKIAPKDSYDNYRVTDKVAPNVEDKLGYEKDPPLQNKIAPRGGSRISFRS